MTSRSATQRVFYLPEVLRMLCDELNEKDLLSAALTSRTFSEPALDRIWRNIRSLDPIIACLPEDLWIRDEISALLSVLVRWSLYLGHVNAAC